MQRRPINKLVEAKLCSDCFDVCTRRGSGEVIMSDNLIRAERITNGWLLIIWGRRCDKVSEAVEVTTNSIVWRRDHKEFRWRRDGHKAVYSDVSNRSPLSRSIRIPSLPSTSAVNVHDRVALDIGNASSRTRSCEAQRNRSKRRRIDDIIQRLPSPPTYSIL